MLVDPGQPAKKETGLSPKAIVAIVLGVLGLIFVFQNTGAGRVNLLFWDVRAPAWAWLLMLLFAGFVIGSIFPWGRRRSSDD